MTNAGTLADPLTIYSAASDDRIIPGNTAWAEAGNYELPTALTFSLNGVGYKPYTLRPTLNPNTADITITANSVTIQGFDIIGVNPNRTSAVSGSVQVDVSVPFVNVTGKYVRILGCRLINIGQLLVNPASEGFELRDSHVSLQGWFAPDRYHGHCCYLQCTGSAPMTIDNCFFGYPAGDGSYGLHMYGDNTALRHLRVSRLVQVNPLMVVGGQNHTPVDDNVIDNSVLWNVGANMGYNSNSDACGTLTLTNNLYALKQPQISANFNPANVTQSGNVFKSDGSNDVRVFACTTPGMTARVCILNWELLNSVNVTVPNMVVGQSYRIENEFDPLNDYRDITWDGQSLVFDFVNRTIATPLGLPLLFSLDQRVGSWAIRQL